MIIDQTPLDLEVRRVFDSSFRPPQYGYIGQFKIEAKVIDIIRVIGMDIQSDYELTYGPVMILEIVLPLGDYSSLIYPVREKLEFILKTEKLDYTNKTLEDKEESVTVETFSVSLLPGARPFTSEDNNMENLGREAQNLMDLVVINIQLKPKLLDDISKMTVGGHFINKTNADLLRNLIMVYCNTIEVDNEQKLLGVDINATASEVKRSSTLIPHNVKLSDLADFLQMKQGGVFPSGMAQFVHERIWYIYPPYDTSFFDESKEKIVIISVPANRYPQVEKTYLTQNGITTILATGNKKITSDKQQIQDNAGNGVMFADANQIVQGFAKDKGNVALISPKSNGSAFVGEERSNGKNNVQMSPEGITANPFIATSRIARSQGHFYNVEWENGDHELIKPGLNVKIMFLNEGEVKFINGVLLKSHVQVKMNGTGLMVTGYRTFIVMQIFVKAEDAFEAGLTGLT